MIEWSEVYEEMQYNQDQSIYKIYNEEKLLLWNEYTKGIDKNNHRVTKEQKGTFIITNEKGIDIYSTVDGIKLINSIGNVSYFDLGLINEVRINNSILLIKSSGYPLLIINPDCFYLIGYYYHKKFLPVDVHSHCKLCTKDKCGHAGIRCGKICNDCLKYPVHCDGCK
jgi:hypothetical protein